MSDAGATWSSVASAYGRYAGSVFAEGRAITEWILSSAEVGSGVTVLDVAGGPGEMAIEATRRGATVFYRDIAEGMRDAARSNAAEAGVEVDIGLADAAALDLADDSVDAIVCRFALMLMPDQDAVVREWARVLRPGGRIAYAVWGPAEANPWSSLIVSVAADMGFEIPLPTGPGMWSLAERSRHDRLVMPAGFAAPSFEDFRLHMRFDDFDAYWTFRLEGSPSTKTILEHIGAQATERVRHEIARRAARYLTDDGLALPAHALGVTARA